MNQYFSITQKSMLFITVLCVSIVSCNQPSNTSEIEEGEYVQKVEVLDEISYQIADHYFAKENVDAIQIEKIESLEKFNSIFQPATVMGMDTTNYPVDFSSNYVIAVILPESSLSETVTPVSLIKKSDGNIIFTYSIQAGKEQTFSTQASLVMVVNKLNDGHIVFINQSEASN